MKYLIIALFLIVAGCSKKRVPYAAKLESQFVINGYGNNLVEFPIAYTDSAGSQFDYDSTLVFRINPLNTQIWGEVSKMTWPPVTHSTAPANDTVAATFLCNWEDHTGMSFSRKGYVIRERTFIRGHMRLGPWEDLWDVVGYLDNDKKPLPKGLIIWQHRIKE